jgi:hypothetical protein
LTFNYRWDSLRIAGHRQKYGDKPDARWNRIRQLAQADEVLRRARI